MHTGDGLFSHRGALGARMVSVQEDMDHRIRVDCRQYQLCGFRATNCFS